MFDYFYLKTRERIPQFIKKIPLDFYRIMEYNEIKK